MHPRQVQPVADFIQQNLGPDEDVEAAPPVELRHDRPRPIEHPAAGRYPARLRILPGALGIDALVRDRRPPTKRLRQPAGMERRRRNDRIRSDSASANPMFLACSSIGADVGPNPTSPSAAR